MSKIPSKRTLAKQIAAHHPDADEAKVATHRAIELRERLLHGLRDLRGAYAELGEHTYMRMDGRVSASGLDSEAVKARIDDLLASIAKNRQALDLCVYGGAAGDADSDAADSAEGKGDATEDAAEGDAAEEDAAEGDATEGDATEDDAPKEDAAEEKEAAEGDAEEKDAAQGDAAEDQED